MNKRPRGPCTRYLLEARQLLVLWFRSTYHGRGLLLPEPRRAPDGRARDPAMSPHHVALQHFGQCAGPKHCTIYHGWHFLWIRRRGARHLAPGRSDALRVLLPTQPNQARPPLKAQKAESGDRERFEHRNLWQLWLLLALRDSSSKEPRPVVCVCVCFCVCFCVKLHESRIIHIYTIMLRN